MLKFKWLEIKKHPIACKKYERIMVYTPSTVKSELAMKYRLIDVDSCNLMKDATHWMKIEPPE